MRDANQSINATSSFVVKDRGWEQYIQVKSEIFKITDKIRPDLYVSVKNMGMKKNMAFI